MGSSASPLPPPSAAPTAAAAPADGAAPPAPAPSPALLLRQALVAFYEVHNPSQLAESLLDEIVGKYLGKEPQLLAKLQRRYGEAPQVPYLSSSSNKNRSSSSSSYNNTGGGADGGGRKSPIEIEITNEARIDLLSPHFDAAFTLSLPLLPSLPLQVKIPIPHAPLLDNLSRCRHLLPPSHEEYLPPLGPSAEAAAAARRDALLASKAAVAAAKGPPVLEALAESLRKGPTALLYRCWKERRRVVVVMRRIDGVRGIVEGELRGFDRHMNIILVEAEEVFVLPTAVKKEEEKEEERGKEGGKGGKRVVQRKRGRRAGKKHKLPQKQQQQQQTTKTEGGKEETAAELPKQQQQLQHNKKEQQQQQQQQQQVEQQQPKVIRRSLPQVLIRGDNVVLIFEAKPEHATRAFFPCLPPPSPSTVLDNEKKKSVKEKEDEKEEGKDLSRPAQAAVLPLLPPPVASRTGGE